MLECPDCGMFLDLFCEVKSGDGKHHLCLDKTLASESKSIYFIRTVTKLQEEICLLTEECDTLRSEANFMKHDRDWLLELCTIYKNELVKMRMINSDLHNDIEQLKESNMGWHKDYGDIYEEVEKLRKENNDFKNCWEDEHGC